MGVYNGIQVCVFRNVNDDVHDMNKLTIYL